MNKKILWAIIVIVILGGAVLAARFFWGGGEDTWLCDNDKGEWVKHGNPNGPQPTSGCGSASPTVGLANPASVNCVNKGGQSEIRTDATGGQYGVCKFSDGSECEEWKFFRGECAAGILDCGASENSKIKKEFKIALADIKDAAKYAAKRQEAVDLINQCYEVNLIQEYEVRPGEVSTEAGVFKNKISGQTQIFDKLKFYSQMKLFDYESVGLDGGLTYVAANNYDKVFDFYKNSQIDGYRPTPAPEENELRWTDIATTKKLIIIKFKRGENGQALINFSFSQPLSAD